MTKLDHLHTVLSRHIDQIRRFLTPEMQVTIVLRHPTNTECEVVVGNDDMDEVIGLLERSKARVVLPCSVRVQQLGQQ